MMTCDGYTCHAPTLFRVDDDPIGSFDSPDNGTCLDIPLTSELAKRIMSSKKFVAELGVNGPQLTFNTEGLDLTSR